MESLSSQFSVNPLEESLGHKFRNPLLLAEALTHASLGHETLRRHFDNQRLEFLGDAVLQLVITEHLYAHFHRAPEGHLTKLRSRLVSRESLKRHAAELGLGDCLMLGRGEEASGGRQRASTLADVYEALLGAIYLDSDLPTVRAVILKKMETDLAHLQEEPVDINPKGELQELLQAISPRSPEYEMIAQTGPEHEKTFLVRVLWEGRELGEGKGRSKKQAETAAAFAALQSKRWESQTADAAPS